MPSHWRFNAAGNIKAFDFRPIFQVFPPKRLYLLIIFRCRLDQSAAFSQLIACQNQVGVI